MKRAIITFRSITPAQRAESALLREGFSCRIQRTPRWMEELGCGYSVALELRELDTCVQILRRLQIPFKKLYLLRDNGAAEELSL